MVHTHRVDRNSRQPVRRSGRRLPRAPLTRADRGSRDRNAAAIRKLSASAATAQAPFAAAAMSPASAGPAIRTALRLSDSAELARCRFRRSDQLGDDPAQRGRGERFQRAVHERERGDRQQVERAGQQDRRDARLREPGAEVGGHQQVLAG